MKRFIRSADQPASVCLRSRAEGLRRGILHDITTMAGTCAQLDVPTAITHRLWETLAPGEPFQANDERVREVCYALAFARVGIIPGELFDKSGGLALRFEFQHRDKLLSVTAVVHPSEDMTLVCTLLHGDEN